MNVAGVFAAFILVIGAGIEVPDDDPSEAAVRRLLYGLADGVVGSIVSSILIFSTMIGVWVWANESRSVAIASTVFVIFAISPYLTFGQLIFVKFVSLWRGARPKKLP